MSKEAENDTCSCRLGDRCKKESPMPTPKHSPLPLPWKVEMVRRSYYPYHAYNVVAANGVLIVAGESEGTSNLIIRAVNSHKELLAFALWIADNECNCGASKGSCIHARANAVLKKAKAEGRHNDGYKGPLR